MTSDPVMLALDAVEEAILDGDELATMRARKAYEAAIAKQRPSVGQMKARMRRLTEILEMAKLIK